MTTSRTRAALALGSVVVLTTGMAAAYATGSSGDGTISSCVSVKTGAMRLEKPKMPCILEGPRKVRERRVTWNEQGLPGVDGAAGPAGPAGTVGPAGPPGSPGAPGTNGLNGTNGDDGQPGVDGMSFLSGSGAPTGSVGHNGDSYLDLATGDVYTKAAGAWTQSGSLLGPAGNDGTNGSSFLSGAGAPADGVGQNGDSYLDLTNGDVYTKASGTWTQSGSLLGPAGLDGLDGAGTIFTASSDTPAAMTTIAGGLAGVGTMFPLSGSTAASVSLLGGTVDTTSVGVAQVLPTSVTVTDMAATFSSTVPLSLIGTTVTLSAQLYTGPGNTLTAVPGAVCTLGPPMTGILAIGTVSSCQTTGLSIPVPAGDKAVVVLTATSTGLSLINTVVGYASTSVATS